MKAEFHIREGYLEVVVGQEYSFPSFISLIDRIAGEGKRNNRTLVVIDAMRTIGIPEDFERFELGVKTAEVLKPPYAILVLAKPEQINKFGETVAVNRGAIVLSTSDREAGMRWLLNKEFNVPSLNKSF